MLEESDASFFRNATESYLLMLMLNAGWRETKNQHISNSTAFLFYSFNSELLLQNGKMYFLITNLYEENFMGKS